MSHFKLIPIETGQATQNEDVVKAYRGEGLPCEFRLEQLGKSVGQFARWTKDGVTHDAHLVSFVPGDAGIVLIPLGEEAAKMFPSFVYEGNGLTYLAFAL